MHAYFLTHSQSPRSFLRRPLSLSVLAMALIFSSAAWASAGHDDAAPSVGGNGPARRPDGSVFLPKPAQRQIGVRTLMVQPADLAQSLELAGKVVIDPNAGGNVQAALAGRLEAGPNGLPSLGQKVKKGDVLAYVIPVSGAIERSNHSAQLAELRSAYVLANLRLQRARTLQNTLPAKELEAAQNEVASLTERISAVAAGLTTRDTLLAPVSGTIASSNAVAGQVVDARELIFEVINPARLHIEALAYAPQIANNIAGASMLIGEQLQPLRFIGAGQRLREQALPLLFSADSAILRNLAVGQSVTLYVQAATTVVGTRVPLSALMKNPANQSIVWVKTAAEQFEPRTVIIAPLDGASVAVLSGLAKSDQVVVQAATLINQIR